MAEKQSILDLKATVENSKMKVSFNLSRGISCGLQQRIPVVCVLQSLQTWVRDFGGHFLCTRPVLAIPAHPTSAALPCHSSYIEWGEEPADPRLAASKATLRAQDMAVRFFQRGNSLFAWMAQGGLIFTVQGLVWLGTHWL